MNLPDNIDDKLNPLNIPKFDKISKFESNILTSFGLLKESVDSFLGLIEKPWGCDVNKLMDYLKNADESDLTDWVSALEIAIVDRKQQDRWTLGLTERTEGLNLPQRLKSILIGIMDALKDDVYDTGLDKNARYDTEVKDPTQFPQQIGDLSSNIKHRCPHGHLWHVKMFNEEGGLFYYAEEDVYCPECGWPGEIIY